VTVQKHLAQRYEWDSSDVLVEILARSLEGGNWTVETASSRGERRYPTGDGCWIYPDLVATKLETALFAEVKSRLFLLKDLTRNHITYHFAPYPRCADAFADLSSRDYRDTGPGEFLRLVKACRFYSRISSRNPLSVVILPDYVKEWKLETLIDAVRQMIEIKYTPVEVWALCKQGAAISLKKIIQSDERVAAPPIPEITVKAVFSRYDVTAPT